MAKGDPPSRPREVELFALAMGHSVSCVRLEDGFQPSLSLTIDQLSNKLLQHEVRTRKDGPYITRPMTEGDQSRSDANSGPWRIVPVDIDELQPEEVPALERWMKESQFRGFLLTTFSHRPDKPKFRLLLIASRDIAPREHALIHRSLERMVPFRIDPCMAKPSQPIFLPSCPQEHSTHAVSKYYDGKNLDIDRLLESVRKDIEDDRQRADARATDAHKSGVRQPGGLVEWFNSNYDLHALLAEKGYRRRSANRYIAPESKSGRAAVTVYNDKLLVSFHDPEHDPLAVRNRLHQAMVLDSFAVYCKLNHQDNFDAAFRGALQVAREAGWEGVAGGTTKTGTATPPPAPPLLLNAEDLYSMVKPQDMVIEGLLDSGTVTIAAGDSNSGKTTILQLLALQVAQGLQFSGRKTKQGIVLWVAGEDIENAKYRVIAMCEEYGIDPVILGDSLLMLAQPIAVLDADSMLAFADSVRKRIGTSNDLRLVVIDSKSVNWGGQEENSNDENAQFVAAVRKFIISMFGDPAVLVTHHLTKSRDKEVRTSRGASSLINNADHEWWFEMNQEARISAMRPGSKIRIERWEEMRFLVKVVNLPEQKLPMLRNNFGDMPRVSIAEPVNQFNRSMKQLKQDTELRSCLAALHVLVDANQPHSFTEIARELGWEEPNGKLNYRKVKSLLQGAEKQKLVKKKGKLYEPTDASRHYLAEDFATEESSTTEPEKESDET